MIKTKKYYSKENKNLPAYIYTCKYMCTECFGYPIYFKDEYCPYPDCAQTCEKINECYKQYNEDLKCDRDKCISLDLLHDYLYRKCRKPKHNLDRTRKVGIVILEALAEKYQEIDIDYGKMDPNFKQELIKEVLEVANAKEFNNYKKVIDKQTCIELIKHYCTQYNEYHNKQQKIKTITVKGLFGYYSYRLDFNPQDQISVILGTNGIGKTTILKFLEVLLFNNNNTNNNTKEEKVLLEKNKIDKINFLLETPYDLFEVDFYDDSKISVIKNENGDVSISYEPRFLDGVEHDIKLIKNASMIEQLQTIENHMFSIDRMFSLVNFQNKFLFIKINRVNDLDSIGNKIYSYISSTRKDEIEKDFYQKYKEICRPSLIDDFKNKINSLVAKINKEKEKKEIIIFDENREKVDLINKKIYFDNEIVYASKEIKEKKEYRKYENINDYISELFILLKNVELFNDNLNSIYTEYDKGRKTIAFNYANKDNYLSVYINNKELPFEKMSSGEINIIMILYDLIFRADSESIILIDEPEVSLHIAWQQQLLDIITNLIQTRKNIQVIIAPHSPFVTSGRSELLVKKKLIK